jgi:serine phosphatase RsbU (regulator of sigma subunit)
MSFQAESPATGRTPVPMELKEPQEVDLHAEYQSARTGGDFFDAINLGSHVIFLLTDIAGTKETTRHLAAAVQDTFRRRSAEFFMVLDENVMNATAQLAQEVNHELIRAARGVRFAPTFIGCYDLSLGVLAYINAGGLMAVLHDSEGTRVLTNASVPMGLFTHLTYEPSMQALEAGATLLLVTKGNAETQQGRSRLARERVMSLLQNPRVRSAKEICRSAMEAAHEFKQAPWYRIEAFSFGHHAEDEDLTALAVVRPAKVVLG